MVISKSSSEKTEAFSEKEPRGRGWWFLWNGTTTPVPVVLIGGLPAGRNNAIMYFSGNNHRQENKYDRSGSFCKMPRKRRR
jgi:hypothetical protein